MPSSPQEINPASSILQLSTIISREPSASFVMLQVVSHSLTFLDQGSIRNLMIWKFEGVRGLMV